MGGYLSVAIGYQLTQAGISVEQVAELVAFSYIPQTWKFLWAPVADTTLSRKRWYVLAGLVSALGIFVTGAVPADERSLPLLYAAVLVSTVASTFLAMATESLMVYNTPPELQGRAGGWFQAGNLGGNGLGGGAGLWLAPTPPAPGAGDGRPRAGGGVRPVRSGAVVRARTAADGAHCALRSDAGRSVEGSLAGRTDASGHSRAR